MNELPETYDSQTLEPKWIERWGNNHFVADPSSGKPPFTVVIPPPNVTGNLHLGHALDNTIIDTLVRYKRMQGFEALYLPGTDHAGIATQVIVERELNKEGLSRFDLGREAFVKRIWSWKASSGGQIQQQLKRLGVSCDWSRERFTLDESLSRAVRHQFVRLYHQGLIYRGERIVNWDVVAQTTLSELEIDRKEQNSHMYTLSYTLENPSETASNGEPGEILIATQRPETIFADQAIAVHPDDMRFNHLIGKKAKIPLTDRWIPIICDTAVEMDFGVGALKITPAHDPTDWEIGERHHLAYPSVIDLQGNLCNAELTPAAFLGMERFKARKAVVQALEVLGCVRETKAHKVAMGVSQRTQTPVEPIVSTQWFVNMKPLADLALSGLDRREMEIHPERYAKVNRDWLENIRDWNISRQLWWGHQIPAWYDDGGNIYVPPLDDPDLDPVHPEGTPLHRDMDVFDTWFSSNLWPFSTLGWPDESPDYKAFYPTSLLVTGYDILFFWVARMQMMGYALTDKAPFPKILLHGLYLDEKGQKMSKAKGNGINPLELIDQYGVDATRFALAYLATGGQDIRHDARRYEQGRHFANKLWNASKFVFMNLKTTPSEPMSATLADRWIVSRLNETVRQSTQELEDLDLGAAIRTLYAFVWDEFCDWYLEAAKPSLRAGNPSTQAVLKSTLETILKLLHPFMPCITSEIWSALGHEVELSFQSWPTYLPENFDGTATQAFQTLRNAVSGARSLKSELGLSPQDRLDVSIQGTGLGTVTDNAHVVESIARVRLVPTVQGKTLSHVAPDITVCAVLEGNVDIAQWLNKSKKRLGEIEQQIKQAKNKLDNPGFVAKAPSDVIEEENRRLTEFSLQKERLEEILAQFS